MKGLFSHQDEEIDFVKMMYWISEEQWHPPKSPDWRLWTIITHYSLWARDRKNECDWNE